MTKRSNPLRQLWRKLAKSNEPRPVVTVAQRFLQAFREHGVEPAQIPRLLPQIGLDDLQSSERLLAVLTPDVLSQAAKFLGIRLQWLEGVDDKIYADLYTYKEPAKLLQHLAAILPSHSEYLDFPLRVLTGAERLDWTNEDQQELAPVLVEKIARLGETDVCRYHVYRDGFDWGYPPARIQLKALARVVYTALHKPVPLYRVSPDVMEAVLEGRRIPREYLNGCRITNPSLEDYALSREESAVAKEVEELTEVLRYIDQERLLEIDRAWEVAISESRPAEPELSSPPTPKAAGKRETSKGDWEKIRAYARALWAEDPTIGIGEMVKRIQANKALKKPALGESAIRKRIRDLAPLAVKKAGRRPKKSP